MLNYVQGKFGDSVKVNFNRDSGVTGNLIVTVVHGGKSTVVHSKTDGDGLVNDSNKDDMLEKIATAIEA